MTVARRIRPVQQPDGPPPPQCTARTRPDPIWMGGGPRRRDESIRRRGYDPDLCAHAASVEIDGLLYCGKHASQEALRRLLGE